MTLSNTDAVRHKGFNTHAFTRIRFYTDAFTTKPPSFDPACLFTIPRLSNTWLTDNVPTGLADRTFAKWLKDLPVLVSNIAKADTWWANQPADAVETIQKVAVMMGIPVCLLQRNFNASNLIKVLTVAINMTNWLDQFLRKKLKHKVLQSYLHLLRTMILVLSILTPFTTSSTISLFQGFRTTQARLMVLSIIHGFRPNTKLKANFGRLYHLWCSSLTSHNLFSKEFFLPN